MPVEFALLTAIFVAAAAVATAGAIVMAIDIIEERRKGRW